MLHRKLNKVVPFRTLFEDNLRTGTCPVHSPPWNDVRFWALAPAPCNILHSYGLPHPRDPCSPRNSASPHASVPRLGGALLTDRINPEPQFKGILGNVFLGVSAATVGTQEEEAEVRPASAPSDGCTVAPVAVSRAASQQTDKPRCQR